jgi:hypothetical protein
MLAHLYAASPPQVRRALATAGGDGASFDACIEDVAFRIQAEYVAIVKTPAGAFVREAIAKMPAPQDFEAIVANAEALFGDRTEHFVALLYGHTRLAAVAAQLKASQEWPVLAELADASKGKTFEEYWERVAATGRKGLLRIDVDAARDEFVVTPLVREAKNSFGK